jgi:hypothetical protein
MANDKATNQELLSLRREEALRELALASSYPQTHSRTVMHRKSTDPAIPVTPDRVRGNQNKPTGAAKP